MTVVATPAERAAGAGVDPGGRPKATTETTTASTAATMAAPTHAIE